MSVFAGTWNRYKSENEEAQLNYIGFGSAYEQIKDVPVEVVIATLSEDSFKQTYNRGQMKLEYVFNIEGESEFDMKDGNVCKVYPKYMNAEKTSMKYELDHKGIHHTYTRQLVNGEMHDVVDYDNGKCISKHYYKKA